MTMRSAHIWPRDCRPPLQQRESSKLDIDAVREAILHAWWGREDKSGSSAPTRRSRLSPEQRGQMLAEVDKGYKRLHSNPEELAGEIAEGRYGDAALAEPSTEE